MSHNERNKVYKQKSLNPVQKLILIYLSEIVSEENDLQFKDSINKISKFSCTHSGRVLKELHKLDDLLLIRLKRIYGDIVEGSMLFK